MALSLKVGGNLNHLEYKKCWGVSILEKYAIVRTISVCLSQDIAYSPRTWTKEGFFCRTSPGPVTGILVQISYIFILKLYFFGNIEVTRTGDQGGGLWNRESFSEIVKVGKHRKRFNQVLNLYPETSISSNRFIPSDRWKYACQSHQWRLPSFFHFFTSLQKR
jgi:hypothetical protein